LFISPRKARISLPAFFSSVAGKHTPCPIHAASLLWPAMRFVLSGVEQLAEICALYLGISPDAAIICMATATLKFGHCLKEYCGGT
jgi:hypothetical protein